MRNYSASLLKVQWTQGALTPWLTPSIKAKPSSQKSALELVREAEKTWRFGFPEAGRKRGELWRQLMARQDWKDAVRALNDEEYKIYEAEYNERRR